MTAKAFHALAAALLLCMGTALAQTRAEKVPRLPLGCTVYGRVLCDGQAVPGAQISDGTDIVLTDRNGWYSLRSDKRNGSVFISIPSCHEAVGEGPRCLPAFWQPLQASPGELERHDFTLRRVDNRRHAVIAFTDAHMANIFDDETQFREGFMPRVREEVARQGDVPVYAINMGDSSYDRYWYEDSYTIADFTKTLTDNDFPVPVFSSMGNHDNDGATLREPSPATVDFRAEDAYRRSLGPVWYSFNLGEVHYVVLDNIVYRNSEGRIDDCEGIEGKRDYEVWFTPEQLSWLKKDLDLISDKAAPVVLATHSPLIAYKNGDGGRIITRFKCSTAPADSLAEAFYSMFRDFKDVHFLTGHTHKNLTCHGADDASTFSIANIIEHNITAVCGCWWQTSAYGGLSLAPDSGPAGFEVFPVDGRSISWYFVSSDDGSDVQFRVFDLNAVRDYYRSNGEARSLIAHHSADFRDYASVEDNLIQVHVWAWEPGWKVSVRELTDGSPEGVELPLVQKKAENPQFTISYAIPKMNWRDGWPGKKYKAALQPHMFTAKASSATSTVVVSVTDGFGRTYSQTVGRPKAFSRKMR